MERLSDGEKLVGENGLVGYNQGLDRRQKKRKTINAVLVIFHELEWREYRIA